MDSWIDHYMHKMKVYAEAPNEPSLTPGPPKFRAIRAAKDDLKGLYKTPVELWDDSFIGEALSDADECHPDNVSFAVGASGGILTGLITGFFSTSRVPTPIRTPFCPTMFPKLHGMLANSIIVSSTAWRIAKRTLLGTILFAVLECDFKDLISKKEDKYQGSIAAGAVCGGVFGLRGGLRGLALGVTLFSSLPAALELYNRRKSLGFK